MTGCRRTTRSYGKSLIFMTSLKNGHIEVECFLVNINISSKKLFCFRWFICGNAHHNQQSEKSTVDENNAQRKLFPSHLPKRYSSIGCVESSSDWYVLTYFSVFFSNRYVSSSFCCNKKKGSSKDNLSYFEPFEPVYKKTWTGSQIVKYANNLGSFLSKRKVENQTHKKWLSKMPLQHPLQSF